MTIKPIQASMAALAIAAFSLYLQKDVIAQKAQACPIIQDYHSWKVCKARIRASAAAESAVADFLGRRGTSVSGISVDSVNGAEAGDVTVTGRLALALSAEQEYVRETRPTNGDEDQYTFDCELRPHGQKFQVLGLTITGHLGPPAVLVDTDHPCPTEYPLRN